MIIRFCLFQLTQKLDYFFDFFLFFFLSSLLIGFICVEGSDNDCDQFWTTIRSWNWQRITMIDVEKMSKSQTQHLTFDSFVEHVDRSTVFRILEQKKCDEIIKNFLGIK